MSTTQRFLLIAMLLGTLLVGCTSAPPADAPVRLRGKAMGTTWQVTIADSLSPDSTQQLQSEIEQRLEDLEQQMSTWRTTSLVSRFNAHHDTAPFAISADLANVIDTALGVHRASGGALDITAGPLVNRWGFGPAGRVAEPPAAKEIASMLTHLGSDRLCLSEHDGQWELSKTDAQLQIDLSAIAKGYAVDETARLLEAVSCENYLIEIGGELRAHGCNQEGARWHVGLEHPAGEPQQPLHAVVELDDVSIATSGSYRQRAVDPKDTSVTYNHVIDPRIGRPITHEVVAVSVIDRDCMRADAWATALLVLGVEQGLMLAEEQGIAACFVSVKSQRLTTVATQNFAPYLESSSLPMETGLAPKRLTNKTNLSPTR